MLIREELGDGVCVFRAPSDLDYWTSSNSVVIVNDDDVVVFDSPTRAVTAKAVIAEIRALTSKPVTVLINSHWHQDHWSGNDEYAKAFPGRRTVATEQTRDYMSRMPARFFVELLGGQAHQEGDAGSAGRRGAGQPVGRPATASPSDRGEEVERPRGPFESGAQKRLDRAALVHRAATLGRAGQGQVEDFAGVDRPVPGRRFLEDNKLVMACARRYPRFVAGLTIARRSPSPLTASTGVRCFASGTVSSTVPTVGTVALALTDYGGRTIRAGRSCGTALTEARPTGSLDRTKTSARFVAAYRARSGPGARTRALATGAVSPSFLDTQPFPVSLLSKTPSSVPA
jgi:hypothetical protein